MNTDAGHKECDRCAEVQIWFLKNALNAANVTFLEELPPNRPPDAGGWCTSCRRSFCRAHTDSNKCILCGTELLQSPAETVEGQIPLRGGWMRVPGFTLSKEFNWPDRCVCCFGSTEVTATLVSELDKQAVTTGHAKVGKSGNVEVNYDSYTKKASVTIHVPYCRHCKSHGGADQKFPSRVELR